MLPVLDDALTSVNSSSPYTCARGTRWPRSVEWQSLLRRDDVASRVRVDNSCNASSSASRKLSPCLPSTVTCAFRIGELDMISTRRGAPWLVRHGEQGPCPARHKETFRRALGVSTTGRSVSRHETHQEWQQSRASLACRCTAFGKDPSTHRCEQHFELWFSCGAMCAATHCYVKSESVLFCRGSVFCA